MGECSFAPTQPVRIYFCNNEKAASIRGTIGKWKLKAESFYNKGEFITHEYSISDYNIETMKLKTLLMLKELGWDIKSMLV